jgi:hypothetical protein
MKKENIMKVKVIDYGTRIGIVSPTIKHWPSIITSCLFIINGLFWTLLLSGMIILGYWPLDQRKMNTTDLNIFWIVFLIFWIVITLFNSINLVWFLIGEEIVNISENNIHIIRRIGLIKDTSHYDSQFVRDLCVTKETKFRNNATRNSYWSNKLGNIEFIHQNSQIRFGNITEEELAKKAITTIKERFPSYKK